MKNLWGLFGLVGIASTIALGGPVESLPAASPDSGEAGTSYDLYLSGLVVYAPLASGSEEAREYGTYPELKAFDPHSGLAPDKVDVVAVANGTTQKKVQVVLEVFPVVGVPNWSRTEGITDTQLLTSSRTELSSFYRLTRKQALDGRTEIKFRGIRLDRLLEHYRRLNLWPAELRVRVVLEPLFEESSLQNNVMELVLPIKPYD